MKKTYFKMPSRESRKGYTFNWKMFLSKKNAELAVLEANLILRNLDNKKKCLTPIKVF